MTGPVHVEDHPQPERSNSMPATPVRTPAPPAPAADETQEAGR